MEFNFQGNSEEFKKEYNSENIPLQDISILPEDGTGGLIKTLAKQTCKVLREKGQEAALLNIKFSMISKALELEVELDKYDINREAIELLFVGNKEEVCNSKIIHGILGSQKNIEFFIIISAVDNKFLLGGTEAYKEKYIPKPDLCEDPSCTGCALEHKKEEQKKYNGKLKNLGFNGIGICLN
jgi:hypothetical protein